MTVNEFTEKYWKVLNELDKDLSNMLNNNPLLNKINKYHVKNITYMNTNEHVNTIKIFVNIVEYDKKVSSKYLDYNDINKCICFNLDARDNTELIISDNENIGLEFVYKI